MVKNSTGGNKSKKQGRKFATPTEMPGQQKVRRAEQVGEELRADALRAAERVREQEPLRLR